VTANNADVAVARRTFVALLKTGSTVNALSLVVLGATAALGAALVARGTRSPAAAALLVAGALAALAELYYAVRVRLDAELLAALEGSGLEAGREAGVAAVKGAAPLGLGAGVRAPDPADPLDAHRRSARLFFRQAAWAALQMLLYLAALLNALL